MDSITHALLGATTAQLGLRQKIGRDASWMAALAALVPDLDFLVAPLMSLSGEEVDGMTRLAIHRGWSHSLLMVPLMSLPVAFAWWYFRRRLSNRRNTQTTANVNPLLVSRRPGENVVMRVFDRANSGAPPLVQRRSFGLLYLCVLIAMATHPLLDFLTSFGTQLLLPFSHAKFAIDAIPIVDIIYTPILILTLLACYIVRRATRTVAFKATVAIGWSGFLLSCGYILAGMLLHNLAEGRAVAAVRGDGRTVISANAYPALGTIFLWRTVVRTDDGWAVVRVHVFSDKPFEETYAVQAANDWIRQARQLEEVKSFNWFAMGQVRAEYEHRDGLNIVKFQDMRYSLTPGSLDGLWSIQVTFDQSGRPTVVQARHFHARQWSQLICQAWGDIWNP